MLREISQHGPLPRIDLAERTGISRATVTSVTADLLQGGLIEEVPHEFQRNGPTRGRPRIDLRIAGSAHLIAGIKVSDSSISFVLMDFNGAYMANHERNMPFACQTPDALATEIAIGLKALASNLGRKLDDISGVGVGISGVVDANDSLVYW